MQTLEAVLSSNTSDYVKEEILSRVWRGRGKVVAATHTPSRTKLAIKIFDLEKCPDDFEPIKHEASMLREVQHPNLPWLLGSFSTGPQVWLLLPRQLCSVAALLLCRYAAGLPELAMAAVVRDVLLALQYLHSRAIIHRGVQGRHILISRSGRAVLSGLRHSVKKVAVRGSAAVPDVIHSYPRYPDTFLYWASPEILHQDLRGYSYPSDVYSLGLTVCELGNAEQPYQDLQPTLMLVEKLKGLVPFLHDATNICADDESLRSSTNSLASNGGLHISTGGGGSSGGAADGGDAVANNSNSRASSADSSCNKVIAEQRRRNTITAQQQRRFSPAAHQFVRRTLALDAQARPTVQHLLSSDAFVRQAKKAGNPSLVALLQLTDAEDISADDNADDAALDDKLSQVTIDDTIWSFEAS